MVYMCGVGLLNRLLVKDRRGLVFEVEPRLERYRTLSRVVLVSVLHTALLPSCAVLSLPRGESFPKEDYMTRSILRVDASVDTI